jgi:hypothetical protein
MLKRKIFTKEEARSLEGCIVRLADGSTVRLPSECADCGWYVVYSGDDEAHYYADYDSRCCHDENDIAEVLERPDEEGEPMDVQCPKESDPTGREPSTPGIKLDAGKAPVMRGVLHSFPLAITAVSDVSAHGAGKYTWRGWETVPDGIDRYGDAMCRHIIKERHGERDEDSGLLHAAHAAWNALVRLELILRRDTQ